MAEHIRFMHNETDVKLRVKRENSGGQYSQIAEIHPGKKDGPYDHIPLTELRFVVQSPKPVYFEIVEGEHEGDLTHLDGRTGHPGGE